MSIDEFSECDILYRINSNCLVGGISDEDFRNNAQPLLEDIRGYFMGRYEVMAEFRPPQMDGCVACHDDLNARIAELTAEMANLRDALHVIAENESWRSGNTDQAIARNALKEGV